MRKQLTVRRASYIRSDGTVVKAASYKIKDRGASGRTPKSERWFSPSVHTGWSKDSPQKTRIAKVVSAHKGDLLAAARSLQALSNVSTDPKTTRLAALDARVLFRRHASSKV